MMKRKFWAVALSLVAVLCLAFLLVCMLVCMAIRGGISADGCICVRSRRDKRCTWQRGRDPCTAQADMAS